MPSRSPCSASLSRPPPTPHQRHRPAARRSQRVQGRLRRAPTSISDSRGSRPTVRLSATQTAPKAEDLRRVTRRREYGPPPDAFDPARAGAPWHPLRSPPATQPPGPPAIATPVRHGWQNPNDRARFGWSGSGAVRSPPYPSVPPRPRGGHYCSAVRLKCDATYSLIRMEFLGRMALATAVALAALEMVRAGREALPLFIVTLLVSGAALVVSGNARRPE